MQARQEGPVLVVSDKDKTTSPTESVGSADAIDGKPMAGGHASLLQGYRLHVESHHRRACRVLVLVDEGKVRLDDPIEKYLPEFKTLWTTAEGRRQPRPPSRNLPLTVAGVREALHTSGMPFKSELETPTLDRRRSRRDADLSATPSRRFGSAGSGTSGSCCSSTRGSTLPGRIIGSRQRNAPHRQFLGEERIFSWLRCEVTDESFGFLRLNVHRASSPGRHRPGEGQDEPRTVLPIPQLLQYPLQKHEGRYPMPGAGLVWDGRGGCARFCRMILSEGTIGTGGKDPPLEVVCDRADQRQTPELGQGERQQSSASRRRTGVSFGQAAPREPQHDDQTGGGTDLRLHGQPRRLRERRRCRDPARLQRRRREERSPRRPSEIGLRACCTTFELFECCCEVTEMEPR